MKKQTFFMLLFLAACYRSDAQDQLLAEPSGSVGTINVNYNTTTGAVGIGTATPAALLDVEGTFPAFKLVDGSQGTGNILTSDASGNATWAAPAYQNIYNTDGSLTANRSLSMGTADLRFLSSGGNFIFMPSLLTGAGFVGIGTNYPNVLLDVVGTNPSFRLADGTQQAGYILTSDASGKASWASPSSIDQNIYNSNGSLTANRTLTMGTADLRFLSGGGNFIFDPSSGSGSVGIGTSSPSYLLDVHGNANVKSTLNIGFGGGDVGQINLFSPALPTSGTGPNNAASLYILVSDPPMKAIEVQEQNQHVGVSLPYTDQFVVYANGVVAIGDFTGISNPFPNQWAAPLAPTPNPTGYSLYVRGGVLAESFKIAPAISPDWFDMVFDSSYALRPLPDVAEYVRDHRHLPDFPSGDEVARNGIDVAKMDGKLLQKIEELTLYVIQLRNELDELKAAKN